MTKKNEEVKISGTEVICKGNVTENFIMTPAELFDYIELGLITDTDLVVYLKLYDLYNVSEGYAFPTIPQLMIYTRKGSKSTINNSIKRLEEVGLIRKLKSNRGNNVYRVFKPLLQAELYKQVPERVEKLQQDRDKLMRMNELDKLRRPQAL